MTDGAHLPIKNANNPGLCLVEDNVIDFVITVHQGAPILGLGLGVGKESYHVVLVWDLTDRLLGFLVDGGCLGLRDGVEGCDLAVVEAGGLAVGAEAYVLGYYFVKFGEGGDG